MSDRRTRTDATGDPRVSAAYREIADESTPEHLDHTILNAARAAARPGWNRAIAWLRPAAWAATIGVCLAIVFEIALLPDRDPADFDKVLQESAPSPAALPGTGAKGLEDEQPQSSRSQELQRPQDPERSAPPDPGGRMDGSGKAADAAVPVVEKTRDRARQLTTGDMKSTAAQAGAPPASDAVPETATERYCDESETGDPGTWMECILRLEGEGLLEAARLERELLDEAFPPPEPP